MFKKYTILALGALIIGGEASGMSYMRRLWAPSAVAAASVLAAKTSLCEENSVVKSGCDRVKPFQLSRSYTFKGQQVVDVLKKCKLPTDICRDENGGLSDCDVQVETYGLSGPIGQPKALWKYAELSTDDQLKFFAGEKCVIHKLFDGIFSTADSDKIIAFRRARLEKDTEHILQSDLKDIKESETQDQIVKRVSDNVQLSCAANYHLIGNKSFAQDGDFLKCILGYAKKSNNFEADKLEKCRQVHPVISDYAAQAATLAVERSAELLSANPLIKILPTEIKEIRDSLKEIKYGKQLGSDWFGGVERMNAHILTHVGKITEILDRYSIKHPARKTNGWLEDLENDLPVCDDKHAPTSTPSTSR